MPRTTSFTTANKKMVTYLDAINMFNNLNKNLMLTGGGAYRFYEKMTDSQGRETCGFAYQGAATGLGLHNILEKMNIKHITFLKNMKSGVNEESEIYIDPKDRAKMLKIHEELGTAMQSNVQTTMDTRSGYNALMARLEKEIDR